MKEIQISKPKEKKATGPEKPPKILKASAFSKLASVVCEDIRGLVHRKKQTDQEWEDYKRFCKLARGK